MIIVMETSWPNIETKILLYDLHLSKTGVKFWLASTVTATFNFSVDINMMFSPRNIRLTQVRTKGWDMLDVMRINWYSKMSICYPRALSLMGLLRSCLKPRGRQKSGRYSMTFQSGENMCSPPFVHETFTVIQAKELSSILDLTYVLTTKSMLLSQTYERFHNVRCLDPTPAVSLSRELDAT